MRLCHSRKNYRAVKDSHGLSQVSFNQSTWQLDQHKDTRQEKKLLLWKKGGIITKRNKKAGQNEEKCKNIIKPLKSSEELSYSKTGLLWERHESLWGICFNIWDLRSVLRSRSLNRNRHRRSRLIFPLSELQPEPWSYSRFRLRLWVTIWVWYISFKKKSE
jgi:hypothetical protein